MNSGEQSIAAKFSVPTHVPANRVIDFDMYNPEGIGEGLQAAWKRLHNPGVPDLVWTPRNGGHWIATRSSLIKEMFRDYEHFSSECPFVPKEAGEQYEFIPTCMNPPQQRPYRSVISATVGASVVHALAEPIRELAISLVEEVKAAGECDFIEKYAEPFPIRVFLMLVDLPEKDAPYLKHLADQITRPDGSMSLRQASQGLFGYLSPVIDERKLKPGKDAISAVIHSKINGKDVTKDEAEKICGLLLLAGLDTVVNFLSFAMQFLAESPKHRRELVDHPELIPAATEELLRRFSLVADGRLVKDDIVVDGVQLKAGDMMLLPTMLSSLDERETVCPMNVDFHRKEIALLTFGHGPHHCAGAHLARLEVATTLREWLTRIPDFSVSRQADVKHQGGVVGAVKGLRLQWNPKVATLV